MNIENVAVSELSKVLLALRDRNSNEYPLPYNIFEVTIEVPFYAEPRRLHDYKFFLKRLLRGKQKFGGITNKEFWDKGTSTSAYNITVKQSVFDGTPILRYTLLCFTNVVIPTNLLDDITERVSHQFEELMTGLEVMCVDGVIANSSGIESSMVWKPYSDFGNMSEEDIKNLSRLLPLHRVHFHGGTLERVAKEIGIIP
jgi:hypothetical protein